MTQILGEEQIGCLISIKSLDPSQADPTVLKTWLWGSFRIHKWISNYTHINTNIICHFTIHLSRVYNEVSQSLWDMWVFSRVEPLCDPMDCSPPGTSVHGISQGRILEWVAISSSRGSSQPRDWTHISCLGQQILYHCATWETLYQTHGIAKIDCVSHWKNLSSIKPGMRDISKYNILDIGGLFTKLLFYKTLCCAALCLVVQSCLILWDSINCSPGSSVLGDSSGKNIGVGCQALLQGIFPNQGLNSGLLHCRQIFFTIWAN